MIVIVSTTDHKHSRIVLNDPWHDQFQRVLPKGSIHIVRIQVVLRNQFNKNSPVVLCLINSCNEIQRRVRCRTYLSGRSAQKSFRGPASVRIGTTNKSRTKLCNIFPFNPPKSDQYTRHNQRFTQYTLTPKRPKRITSVLYI